MSDWAASDHSDDRAFDPFAATAVIHGLGAAPDRSRVVIEGTVRAVDAVAWVGGPVLEVALTDGDDAITLVFFGRRELAGVEPGRRLAAWGTIGRSHGRRVILNPVISLRADPHTGVV